MSIASLIRQHAATQAAAGNWAAVAAAILGLGLRAPSRKCFSVETGATLAAAGVNWPAVMTLIDGDATGRFLLTKLASDGVEWAHSMTVPYLRSKQGTVLTSAGVNALIELSAPLLYPTLTAAECQAAMQAESARQALAAIQTRRLRFDSAAASVRSQIETGQLSTNAEIGAAVETALASEV